MEQVIKSARNGSKVTTAETKNLNISSKKNHLKIQQSTSLTLDTPIT